MATQVGHWPTRLALRKDNLFSGLESILTLRRVLVAEWETEGWAIENQAEPRAVINQR